MEPQESTHVTGGQKAMNSVPPTSDSTGRLFVALIAIYAMGLAVWLVVGLLPTLAEAFPVVHHWVQTVALSHSVLAGPAGRILDANQSMHGMALDATNSSSVALQYSFSLLNVVLGVILVTRLTHELVPRLLAFAFLGTAATFNKPSHAVFHILGEPWPIKSVHFTFHIVSGVAYLWAVLLFPDGRLPRRIRLEGWPLWAVVAVVTLVVTVISWRSSFINHPQFFVVFFGVAVSVFGMATQAMKASDPLASVSERRSSRLLAAALLPAFAIGVAWLVGRALVAVGGPTGTGAEHFDTVLQGVFPAVFAVVPVVLFAGILRYRLWNIDWLLSRALPYGFLAAGVAAVYVAVVSLSDVVFGFNVWSSVVVLGLVAVAIDPARRVMRAWSNRVVYGQVLTPTEAVRAVLAGLEDVEPGAELRELTRVAVEATRATRCELWLRSNGEEVRVAFWPEKPDGVVRTGRAGSAPTDQPETEGVGTGYPAYPIEYKGRALGTLILVLPPGEPTLNQADRELVDSLVVHAGVAVHNAGLNIDLARHIALLAEQVEELRASRHRVVTAQDAERRKLERDLHDGAQQSLVAILIGLRSVERSVMAEPDAIWKTPPTEVEEMSVLLRDAANMLDDLISNEGPRVLTDRGLAGALETAGGLARRTGLQVTVECSVEHDLPPDKVAAIYFCCLEALQNASKHSRAKEVRVEVTDVQGVVAFEVSDDGEGFDPSVGQAGSGMGNLVSRLTVLGGDVIVEAAPGHGTRVRGWLPIEEAMVVGGSRE
jgi:signal transduction histidine kinase